MNTMPCWPYSYIDLAARRRRTVQAVFSRQFGRLISTLPDESGLLNGISLPEYVRFVTCQWPPTPRDNSVASILGFTVVAMSVVPASSMEGFYFPAQTTNQRREGLR